MDQDSTISLAAKELSPAFYDELARRDFYMFVHQAFPLIHGGHLLDGNWHLDATAYQLSRVDEGEVRRLLVTLPPRNLKSFMISVAWVAWMLGRDPTRSFVCVSYSNELSSKLARDCKALMESSWYRRLFPKTVISNKRSANYDFNTTRGGGRLATSTSGTLTGRGGDFIIIDDAIKPADANSDAVREQVNDWYRSTLSSRLNDKRSGAIICVMQRLHQYDLAGMMLEDGGWTHLNLPAIAPCETVHRLTRNRIHRRKAEEVLHEEREPLAVLEQIQREQGSSAFSAQYQQAPVPAVGNIVKAHWLVHMAEPFPSHGEIVQSWDTASKAGGHNDYSVCVTARLVGKYVYVLDVLRKRLEFPDLLKTAVAQATEWRTKTLLVEDAASGTQLIHMLRDTKEPGVPLPIARHPEQDKDSRMRGVSSLIESGRLILPASAPWLADFKSELLAFPNGRFDDQADALAQLLMWVTSRIPPSRTSAGPILVEEGSGISREYYDPNAEDPWSGL